MDDQLKNVARLYERLIDAWNGRDAAGMAALYAPKGSQVGFDGSIANGPGEIEALLKPIFADHPTARFVTRIRETRAIGPDTAMLRAVAGMIPPGGTDIMPERNAIQTLVASRDDGGDWRIEMFHNTPAAFDGRPEEAEKLSAELRAAMAEAEERELA
jgi:uncharacterized protein (TIGR02246 family)